MQSAGTRELWSGALLGVCLALSCVACAGAAPPADSAPPPEPGSGAQLPPEPQPGVEHASELEALDLDLRAANEHLEQQLGRLLSDDRLAAERDAAEKKKGQTDDVNKAPDAKERPAVVTEKPGADKPVGPAKQPSAKPAPPPSLDLDEEPEDRTVGVRGSPCDLGCRALKSMQSSAARICELAGKDSARCMRATQMVAKAAERVRAAGCQCTTGGRELMSSIARPVTDLRGRWRCCAEIYAHPNPPKLALRD